MINIDFLISGCNTRCRHCYVNGGPGPMMSTGDAILCIERLDALAAYLPQKMSFTLDHEPMIHPQIAQIIPVAAQTKHIQNCHHGMTTGIGLMHRRDKDTIVKAYLDQGYDTFGITIHGNAEHHDEIVRRKQAYDASVSAANYLKVSGASLNLHYLAPNSSCGYRL